ncbi:MAG: Nif3-like dinuclear metal center hexameric protein [Bacillota bacterium]|nr:Nif3-like dinuclear metal center hexameric protein [Bacillota bacterium]
MKLKDIMEALDKLCPFSMQEAFDNSGLQVGDMEKDCKKILLAFDFTEEVLKEAIKTKADLIITHHPFLFTPLKSISTANWKGRQIFRLIRENIALVALHTNLDKEPQFGVSMMLGRRLGLTNPQILLPEANGMGFGCIGELSHSMVYGDFVRLVQTTLNRPAVKYVGDKTKRVQRIAVSGGSCAEFMDDAQKKNADVFICGDLKYHDAPRAQENELCLIDAGHFGTEVWVLDALQKRLRQLFHDMEIEICAFINDYWNYQT